MFEKLAELINAGDLKQAALEFQLHQNDTWTEEFAILAATLFLQMGQREEAFSCIRKGLLCNYRSYELYLLLGNYYEKENINQAWLCYENAEFYCDNKEDLDIILKYKSALECNEAWSVKSTSIVILSYNVKELTQQCIESIRQNNLSSSYELILVDNHSTDGIREWLQEQKDIKLLCNSENKGFPYGCNQGIKMAEPENNIFLLNSDTIVPPNAIFWLRMGLYENDLVGATGSVSNRAGDQLIQEQFNTIKEYIAYGEKNNIPRTNPYEKKIYLIGFALMLKRQALDNIGLLDVRFSPGLYEDVDLGIRLNREGWQVLLCKNSFIYHYGGGDGKNDRQWNELFYQNALKLKEKWKFDIRYYTYARWELINLITHKQDQPIHVLEIGCGMGATLAKIQYFWPMSEVRGIEIDEHVADIGSNCLDIIQGNIETMEIPYSENEFDYIILADVLEHLHEPEKVIKRLIPYLKKDGAFLCSIPNIMHISAFLPLLRGQMDYQDSGILDRAHLRFFTLDSIVKLFQRCGLTIEALSGMEADDPTEQETKMLDVLEKVPGVASRDTFLVYQYVFRAGKMER